MPAANLEATVKKYNLMVDLGIDPDFAKPSPKYKIETPPFYAAWATLTVHDTYAGLRINMKCQVMDERPGVRGSTAAATAAGAASWPRPV
jgi:hypothetical protein